MMPRDGDSDLVLFVLMLLAMTGEDDPFIAHVVYDRIRQRLRRAELLDPEVDELLHRALRHPSRSRERRGQEAREAATGVLDGFRRAFEESTSRRIDEIAKRLEGLVEEHVDLAQFVNSQASTVDTLRNDAQTHLWLSSAGVDLARVPLVRYVPVRLYLTDPLPERVDLDRILARVLGLLENLGFDRAQEFPEEAGSWWKRLTLKTKELLTHREVRKRLRSAEKALEIACLDKPQAEANRCQAEAAAQLITALQTTSKACIQAGSLLIVKVTTDGESAVLARTLTPLELKRLEENQSMLRRPDHILDWLQKVDSRRLPDGSA